MTYLARWDINVCTSRRHEESEKFIFDVILESSIFKDWRENGEVDLVMGSIVIDGHSHPTNRCSQESLVV